MNEIYENVPLRLHSVAQSLPQGGVASFLFALQSIMFQASKGGDPDHGHFGAGLVNVDVKISRVRLGRLSCECGYCRGCN